MRHVELVRDRQRQERNPGHEIGTFLLSHSNSPAYLVSQLTVYLEAAKADRQAAEDFAQHMLDSMEGN